MTEYRRYRRRPRQSTKALTAKLAVFATIVTLVIGGLIAAQMAAGNDPALGPKATAKTKKATTSSTSSSSGGSSSQVYGEDDYYPYSGGYSSGSGYSTQQSAPAPVTSSTS
jgi:hypothetical protein